MLTRRFQPKPIKPFVLYHIFFFSFFNVRLLSVLCDHSFFHPRHNGQWPPTSRISIPDFIHYIFCPIFILQKEPVFPFLMLGAKQGITGTIFITSLWRGPCLGIEPGTSLSIIWNQTCRVVSFSILIKQSHNTGYGL